MFQLISGIVRTTASVAMAIACVSMAIGDRKAHKADQAQSSAPAAK